MEWLQRKFWKHSERSWGGPRFEFPDPSVKIDFDVRFFLSIFTSKAISSFCKGSWRIRRDQLSPPINPRQVSFGVGSSCEGNARRLTKSLHQSGGGEVHQVGQTPLFRCWNALRCLFWMPGDGMSPVCGPTGPKQPVQTPAPHIPTLYRWGIGRAVLGAFEGSKLPPYLHLPLAPVGGASGRGQGV